MAVALEAAAVPIVGVAAAIRTQERLSRGAPSERARRRLNLLVNAPLEQRIDALELLSDLLSIGRFGNLDLHRGAALL